MLISLSFIVETFIFGKLLLLWGHFVPVGTFCRYCIYGMKGYFWSCDYNEGQTTVELNVAQPAGQRSVDQ